MHSWHEFFTMGGYARFVWSAYGIAALVIVVNVAAPLVAHRRVKRRIRSGVYDDE